MKKAVAGIIYIKGKILLGKKVLREGHFVSGGWHIPGGNVNSGETEEEALIREYKEETGLDIIIAKKIFTHFIKESDVELTWFMCTALNDQAVPADDLTEIKFVEPKEVLKECDERALKRYPKEIINCFLKL